MSFAGRLLLWVTTRAASFYVTSRVCSLPLLLLRDVRQVTVPGAELEEILPAARLLSAATSEQPIDYERAKAHFLEVPPPPRPSLISLSAQSCPATKQFPLYVY
jgi:hypothetical protein